MKSIYVCQLQFPCKEGGAVTKHQITIDGFFGICDEETQDHCPWGCHALQFGLELENPSRKGLHHNMSWASSLSLAGQDKRIWTLTCVSMSNMCDRAFTSSSSWAQACKFSGPRCLETVELWNSSFFRIDFKLKPELELIDNGLQLLQVWIQTSKNRCKERRNRPWDKAPHPSHAHVKVHIRLLPWPTKLASSCVWRQLN